MNSEAIEVERRALVTRSSLVAGLGEAGVSDGDSILVHTSMARLGFVVGAARTVIEALIQAVGVNGTVMMPTYSGELSDPAEWRYPSVPSEWIEKIRAETPAYDPWLTPTRSMGIVAELFRHYPGARRSPHPHSSFAALGKAAAELVDAHPVDYRFGPNSPLGKIADIGGKVLLLGAAPQTCSFYYLSQHYTGSSVHIKKSAPIINRGQREWVDYVDVEYPNAWFNDATNDLVADGIITKSRLGNATCFLMCAPRALDAVVAWRKQRNV
jgi:aminoglycoside 3-N-acetyltransferase